MGNPRRLILTPGQASDVRIGPDLIQGEDTEAVIADKAYDSDEFLALIAQMGAKAIVPPKANRINQREYDENLYADGGRAIGIKWNVFITRLKTTGDWLLAMRKQHVTSWPSGI